MDIDHGLKTAEENSAAQINIPYRMEDSDVSPKLDSEIQAASFLNTENGHNPALEGDDCEALLKWNQITKSALSTEESIHSSLELENVNEVKIEEELEVKKIVNKPSIIKRRYSEPKKKEIVINVSDLPSHMIPVKQKTDKERFIEITLGVFLVISSAFLIHE